MIPLLLWTSSKHYPKRIVLNTNYLDQPPEHVLICSVELQKEANSRDVFTSHDEGRDIREDLEFTLPTEQENKRERVISVRLFSRYLVPRRRCSKIFHYRLLVVLLLLLFLLERGSWSSFLVGGLCSSWVWLQWGPCSWWWLWWLWWLWPCSCFPSCGWSWLWSHWWCGSIWCK